MTSAERLRVTSIINELTAIKDNCSADLNARWNKMVPEGKVPGELFTSDADLATFTAIATEKTTLEACLAVLNQL